MHIFQLNFKVEEIVDHLGTMRSYITVQVVVELLTLNRHNEVINSSSSCTVDAVVVLLTQ